MSEEENSQTVEGRDNPMEAPYLVMTKEVRIMLVDNDKEFVTEMTDLLKSYNYKVITVGTASTAMSMLFKGVEKIDVMMINVDSSNLISFQLLAHAVALDIISLFVCDEHNELLAKKALKEGAYLYLKKPFDEKIVKYLWQFVLTEKLQREKAREGSKKRGDRINIDDFSNSNIVGDNEEGLGRKKNVSDIEEQSNDMHEDENGVVSNRKYELSRKKGTKSTQINEGESQSVAIEKVVRQKGVIKWTADLHAKFMEVVEQLGDERCFPKEILELMNVPGLTKAQVASHLQISQKCRRNNWRAPKKRKYIRHSSHQAPSSGAQQRSSFRKFGTMPRLQTDVSNLQHNPDQTQSGQEFPFPTLNTDNIFAREESSIQQQLYSPQLQVQPHYLSIDNPFNNQFLSVKNNIGGGLQQQHETIFEMLGSQGLDEPIIGNSNYRPGLTFDSGYHHIQSDYNLDLDKAHRTTYSGSGIMFGTDVGNARVNDYKLNVNMENNYKPALTFDSGYHHIQRDYNLDLDAFHGTTYSGSGIMFGTDVGNARVNDYNLNVNMDNVTTYLGNTIMSNTYIGNMTINGLGAPLANFQQYFGEPNMSDPSNIIAASYEGDIVGSDSNEKENCDAYFNLNNMINLFQNLVPPSANRPNEQSSVFNQVCSDDQVAATSNVQFTTRANYSDESSI